MSADILPSMSQGQDWHEKLSLCRVSTEQSQKYHYVLYPSIPSLIPGNYIFIKQVTLLEERTQWLQCF